MSRACETCNFSRRFPSLTLFFRATQFCETELVYRWLAPRGEGGNCYFRNDRPRNEARDVNLAIVLSSGLDFGVRRQDEMKRSSMSTVHMRIESAKSLEQIALKFP